MNVSPAEGGTIKINETFPNVYPNTTTYPTGTAVTVEAIPADGYEFAGWSGDQTGTANPITLEMTCPKSITASFIQKEEFRLTIEVKGGGYTNPAIGVHGYPPGTVVKLLAAPGTGYQFENWTGDVVDPSSFSTTITMDSDKTITANFSPRATHIVTIKVTGGGTVTPSPGEHTSIEGSRLQISATPEPGYQFTGWTGEVSDPNAATTVVTVNADMTVTANFARVYNLSIAVKGFGSVSPAIGSHDYIDGAVVNISATPDEGYSFKSWTGDVADAKSATTTVTIDSDMTVTANFSKTGGLAPWLLSIIIAAAVVAGGVGWLMTRRQRKRR